jgi:murein DD-endopeptidase MepM/ murein hydrolase activator NlpD
MSLMAAAPEPPAPAAASPARSAARPLAGARLLIPVAGVRPEALVDTFTQAREGGARVHDAIDILAPRGTPVVAAAPGKVEKLFLSKQGGMTVYQRSPDGTLIYYYAHLDGYAPRLGEGQVLRAGDPLGFVGATGNANPSAPHLHFAVMQTVPLAKWWEPATALNPYPLLGGR